MDGVTGLGGSTPGARPRGSPLRSPGPGFAPFGKHREWPGRASAGGDTVSPPSNLAHRTRSTARGHGHHPGSRPPAAASPRRGGGACARARTGAHTPVDWGVPAAPAPGRPLGLRAPRCRGAQPPQRGPRVASSDSAAKDPKEGEAGRRAGRCHLTAPVPAPPTLPLHVPPSHQRTSGPAAFAARTGEPSAFAAATSSELCPGRSRSASRPRRGRRGPRRVAEAARRPGRKAGGPRAMGGGSAARGWRVGGERGRRSRCHQRRVRVLPQRLASAAAPAGLRHRGAGARPPAGCWREEERAWGESGTLSSPRGLRWRRRQ